MRKTLILVAMLISPFVSANVSEGVIMESECNNQTGRGMIKVLNVEKKTAVLTWIRVKSDVLCKGSVLEPSILAKRSLYNLTSDSVIFDSLFYDNKGFLSSIQKKDIVESDSFLQIDKEVNVDLHSTFNWYYNNH